MTTMPGFDAALRTFGDVSKDIAAVGERLRKLSKECLVLAAACEIATRAEMFHPKDADLRRELIDRECKVFEDWRKSARLRNRTKRLESLINRLNSPKPKRRRRRRSRAIPF